VSAYGVGVFMLFVALAVFVAGLAMLGIRAIWLMKRAKVISAKPAFLALAALPGEAERINASLQRLAPLGARLDAVARDIAAAAASTAGLMVDIELVASATEDLLDAVAPSLRGVAAI